MTKRVIHQKWGPPMTLVVGQYVFHKKFGVGRILCFEEFDAQSRAQVSFEGDKVRWLMLAYANLMPADPSYRPHDRPPEPISISDLLDQIRQIHPVLKTMSVADGSRKARVLLSSNCFGVFLRAGEMTDEDKDRFADYCTRCLAQLRLKYGQQEAAA